MNDDNVPRLPQFDDLSDVIEQRQFGGSPSEVHGVLCAFVCAGHKMNGKLWLESVLGTLDETVSRRETTRQCLLELYDISSRQLKDPSLCFQLLLPDDAAGITQRVDALGYWCRGFIAGLEMAGVDIDEIDDDGEVDEVLSDLSEIANVDDEFLASNEEDEVAFTEVVEYVRMAAILLYGEFEVWQSGSESDASVTRLH